LTNEAKKFIMKSKGKINKMRAHYYNVNMTGGITMKKWGLMSAVLIVGFLVMGANTRFAPTEHFKQKAGVNHVFTRSSETASKVSPQDANSGLKPAKVKIEKDYGKMPLYFIPNQGQIDKKVYYYVQGKDKTVYFTSEGVTYSLNASGASGGQGLFLKKPPLDPAKTFDKQCWVVKLDFVGARKDVKPESLEKSKTVISYFTGQKKDWKAGLQTASKILYRDLWPGIDLVYYGTLNKMKYEFIVNPGADPSQIKLAYRGAESVKENSQGQLEVQTPVGSFQDDTPVAWQEIGGKRENVTLKYEIEKGKSGKETRDTAVVNYGFTIGKYDPKQKLVLDPAVLVYCGYIGGSNTDDVRGIAVDASGCAYVTGFTDSTQNSFPVTVGPDLIYNNGDHDAFVAKVNAAGTDLVYCGYIGGSEDDYGEGIAVDASGFAYVTGFASSTQTTFPVIGELDLTYNGDDYDSFVAKVNATGTELVYCGYIGGSNRDYGFGITVDASGCAYVIGYTESDQTTFPVVGGPDLAFNGGLNDAFVAKVKSDGTGLDFCGYIGGSGDEKCYHIAVDASGCAYIIGLTNSTETTFPVEGGPDLIYNGGNDDAFVAKIEADGSGLIYCGYIGGSGDEHGHGIAVDESGCAYVTGYTNSDQTAFPVTGDLDSTYNGGTYDAFVAKITTDGTGLNFCGYIGGAGEDSGYGIAVDASGCAYVAGRTQSDQTTFPAKVGPDLTFNGTQDTFVAKVDAAGIALDYCGYIGGSNNDYGNGIAVDASGCAYVIGDTYSDQATFPVTVGPDLTQNGTKDAFVAKISMNYTVNFAAGTGGSLTGTTSQTVLQGNNCTAVEAVPDAGYFFINWTGTNEFVTTTDNPLTVTNVTSDMTITANFIETGWIPLEGLQYNMIVYGKAYNGNNPAAEGDWLGAFGPGGTSDCRAIAAVQTNGNYYITIGSNETSGETITFRLWPLPSGPSIDSSESITFIENGVYAGLPLHFGPREQTFNLVNGWNWISFNTLPTDTSFNSVFGTLTGAIEQVKSQNQAAIYSGGNWIGDLTGMNGIADGIMYKVKTNQACAFNVSGMTVPFNTPLSLVTGWNWTAYLPTLSQPVQDAVSSIFTPVSQVKSQTQSVIKIGSILFGDLTEMEPNKGYLILMNQPGVLEYPQGESTFPVQAAGKTAAIKAQAVSWPVMTGNQYNMVALGRVYFEGKTVNTPGYYLGSIGPNGANDSRSLSPVKTDGTYFATILGNTGGETVKFKLVNSSKGKTFDVAGSLEFQPDGLKTGFDLRARSVKVTAPTAGAALRMGAVCTIAWEAYEVNNVNIELYKGSKLFSTIASSVPAGSGTYSWKIPSSMNTGNDYQVKVSCIDPGATAEGWTKVFSIKPAPSLTLISPNGGEVWQVKRSYNITWRSTGIDKVKIELYKGTELETVISAGTPAGSGKYTWTIPANQPQGANYKIKISGVEIDLSDTGDRVFSITGTSTGN
jgi:hypothetical protein